MNPEEVTRLDLRDGDWTLKAREWQTIYRQIGRAMRWTTKPVKGEMDDDNMIISEFKMKMTMILTENEVIENIDSNRQWCQKLWAEDSKTVYRYK